ncbi:hypothetical protein CSA37_08295 [Candidatus Fermentibacteria bacterium]|nr:MAG: hypothetical protein CSA37_08295 [Candidatus Fermentibacteria bacterium]
MREVFLTISIYAATLGLYSRHDGIVLQVVGSSRLSPQVSASGRTVTVLTGEAVEITGEELPVWLLGLDSCESGFTAVFDTLVTSVDWALSGDSLSLLLFGRSPDAFQLPEVSWQAPPARPDTALWSDSLVYAAFESGSTSPWLVDFDTIVIDPGHGGRDPGAMGPSGTCEKDRTLEIALMVRDLLQIRMPELRVVLTRTTDEYVSLGARTRLANRSKADLFVSIHCNAAENREANGFETYFLSRARTDDARAVEMLENDVLALDDVPSVPDDPLSFLLADMAQSVFQNQSSFLAGVVQDSFRTSFPANRNRGVKRAGFFVLRGAYMPAVLIEVAFITNRAEEQNLLSLDFRFRAAQAIVESIVNYAEREIQ